MVGKGFYKGNRTGSMGRHTKHGGFVIDWKKVRTYVVPNLAGFQVGPPLAGCGTVLVGEEEDGREQGRGGMGGRRKGGLTGLLVDAVCLEDNSPDEKSLSWG